MKFPDNSRTLAIAAGLVLFGISGCVFEVGHPRSRGDYQESYLPNGGYNGGHDRGGYDRGSYDQGSNNQGGDGRTGYGGRFYRY